MNKSVCKFPLIITASITLLSACSSVSSDSNNPAVRVNITPKAQQALQQTLEANLHAKNIGIAKNALTQSNTLIIERENLQSMDFSKPFIFKLYKQGQQCILQNQQTKQRMPLTNTQCKIIVTNALY